MRDCLKGCKNLGNTTSIRVLRTRPMSMKELCKSTPVLDLQIFQLHRTSFQ